MKAGTPPGWMRESHKDNATGQGTTKDNSGMGFRDYHAKEFRKTRTVAGSTIVAGRLHVRPKGATQVAPVLFLRQQKHFRYPFAIALVYQLYL